MEIKKKISRLINRYKIKTVIHCAAFSYVLDGEKNKRKYKTNNIDKTKKFINECYNNNIENFIFLSSSNVYKENRSIKKNIFKESNNIKPKNLYGQNKVQIEKYISKKKFKSLIILRLFNIIGLNKPFKPHKFKKNNFQRLIFKILESIRSNKEIKINYIKNKNKIIYPSRDFLDIQDFLSLINKIINKLKKKKISGIFNVGSGKSVPINILTKILIKKLKKNTNFEMKKLPSKEIYHTKANIKKVSDFFNWNPRIKLEDSIKSYLKKKYNFC